MSSGEDLRPTYMADGIACIGSHEACPTRSESIQCWRLDASLTPGANGVGTLIIADDEEDVRRGTCSLVEQCDHEQNE